jgi:RimJ/RimL family protein N-acetyltransferase
MHHGVSQEFDEAAKEVFPADKSDRERLRKQQEIMNRVLANTVVNQLLQSGCDTGQMIDFTAEILENVTVCGFQGEDPKVGEGGDTTGSRAIEVCFEMVRNGASLPEVRGERTSLRGLTKQDIPLLKRWAREPHIQRTCSHRLLKERIRDGVTNSEKQCEFIFCDEEQRPIGLVSLFHIQPHIGQGKIAKLVGEPGALGKGFAREASAMLITYAFHVLKLQRLYLRTAGFNMQNIKLNEALGFQFEGILRSSEIFNGELIDVVLMSMLRTEFDRIYSCRIREEQASAVAG